VFLYRDGPLTELIVDQSTTWIKCALKPFRETVDLLIYYVNVYAAMRLFEVDYSTCASCRASLASPSMRGPWSVCD
jgi:hypothetical protein